MYEKLIRISLNALKIIYAILGLFTIISFSSISEIIFESSFDKEVGIVVGVLVGIWTYQKLVELKVKLFNYLEAYLESEK